MSIKKTILRAAASVAFAASFATAAAAATFTVVPGASGTATTLPSTFSLSSIYGSASPVIGDSITSFSGASGSSLNGGLHISASSALTYTFLGKEASAKNALFTIGGSTLTNTMAAGSSVTVNQGGPGFVDYLFQTVEGVWEDINSNGTRGESLSIANNGLTQYTGLSIAYGAVFNNGRSVLAFFGDGRGDSDYDDMVIRIDAVPLPASALLLFGALGGLGAVRARRKKAAAA